MSVEADADPPAPPGPPPLLPMLPPPRGRMGKYLKTNISTLVQTKFYIFCFRLSEEEEGKR